MQLRINPLLKSGLGAILDGADEICFHLAAEEVIEILGLGHPSVTSAECLVDDVPLAKRNRLINMQEWAEEVLEGIALLRLKVRSQRLNPGRQSVAHIGKPMKSRGWANPSAFGHST